MVSFHLSLSFFFVFCSFPSPSQELHLPSPVPLPLAERVEEHGCLYALLKKECREGAKKTNRSSRSRERLVPSWRLPPPSMALVGFPPLPILAASNFGKSTSDAQADQSRRVIEGGLAAHAAEGNYRWKKGREGGTEARALGIGGEALSLQDGTPNGALFYLFLSSFHTSQSFIRSSSISSTIPSTQICLVRTVSSSPALPTALRPSHKRLLLSKSPD